MLCVDIAENLLSEMNIANYKKYFNIKSLTAYNYALTVVTGLLIAVHLIQFLEILNFIPKFKIYTVVLYKEI